MHFILLKIKKNKKRYVDRQNRSNFYQISGELWQYEHPPHICHCYLCSVIYLLHHVFNVLYLCDSGKLYTAA